MHNAEHVETLRPTLKDKVRKFTGESVAMCYQCGKCAAGCPLAEDMDYSPNQILRMLQLGMPELDEKILGSLTIWLCLTCETCFARCPKEVDLPVVMDFLRSESLRLGKVNPKAKDIIAFHKTFLDSIRLTGRLQEVGLIAGYKMRRMQHLLQDVNVAPRLFINGKLSLLPHNVKNREAIARMFEKAAKEQEEER